MLEQVDHEIDVRADAPNAKLAQGAVHPRDRGLGRGGPSGDFLKQAIIVARDHSPRIGRAAIKADAHARGTPIGRDAAVIGDEIIGRILGRDPALDGVTVKFDVILAGHTRRFDQRFAFGDQDLRAHDVDACHLFGDGMFDLHTGVHLDEVKCARVHIHQEFDSARAFVVHMFADLLAKQADLFALGLAEIGGGGAFHDLLVAPLDRAIALVKMVDIAVAVAQYLYLDMARAQDHLFQIPLAIAKGGLGLAAPLADLFFQFRRAHDRAHPASTTTPGRLEHERIAHRLGLGADRVHVVAQHFGRGDDRHTGRHRHAPGAGLVAKRAHRVGLGADEGDAIGRAGIDEIGVFRQQPIARMDRIGPRQLGHADDLIDREIGRHGAKPLADLIGLIGLEAVQAQLVLFGIDRHGAFAQFIGRAHDTDGDLAAVGDEDLLEFGHVAAPFFADAEFLRRKKR